MSPLSAARMSHFFPLSVSSGVYKSKNIPDGSTDVNHLLWMLYELNTNTEMSLTKKHRWLGFIQGCLIKDGIIDLKAERNRTRDILKGA